MEERGSWLSSDRVHSINCVKGEIHNMLTVLRNSAKQAKESTSSSSSSASASSNTRFSLFNSDTPHLDLVTGFKDLYDSLGFYTALDEVDVAIYLQPFLRVVRSEYAAAEPTRTAILSVHKFLLYGFITDRSPGVSSAIRDLAQSAIDCKFQAAGAHAAEGVYMKVMEILLECVKCPAGYLLTNDIVCNMFQVCFFIRSDKNSSALSKQYAENMLMQLVLVVFARISLCVPSGSLDEEEKGTHLKMLLTRESIEQEKERLNSEPYGIFAMYRVLKYLANMISLDDQSRDRETREFGLRLINIALETAGPHIASHEILLSVVQDELCKQLLQNSQTNYPSILSLTLRIVFNLFSSVKQHLKVQLEVFFTSIHLRIGDNPNSSFEQRELVLESLVEFCHEPSLIVGLYRNYDCEVASTNLFEDLCKFLSQQALPILIDEKGASHKRSSKLELSNLNTLALEAILAVLRSISKRFCDSSVENIRLEVEDEMRQKHLENEMEADNSWKLKKILDMAAQRFNAEGPKSFKFLQSLKLVSDPLEPTSLARFLKETPNLDHYLIGAYLGMPHDFNKQVLHEYASLFDFSGMRIDEALRIFLESFVLPGESQIIERIMENFARRYYSQNSASPIASEDAAFVLAYSVIMLNTDAHNPNVGQKMSLEQWIKNNQNLNQNSNFPQSFLIEIYDSITRTGIQIRSANLQNLLLPDGTGVNSLEWNHLISRSRKVGDFKTSAAHISGKEMFSMLWVSAISILSFYVERCSSTKVLQRIVEGYHAFAKICAVYGLNDIFNNLVISLSKTVIDLLESCSSDPNGFSPLESFGRNIRAQRVSALLFNLILSHREVNLIEAWPNVIDAILWLNHLGLLPPVLTQFDDFRDREGNILPSLKSNSAVNEQSISEKQTIPKKQASSFLSSAIFSLWSSVEEEEDDGNDMMSLSPERKGVPSSDIEYIQFGKESIQSCQIEELFASSRYYSDASLDRLIQTLVIVSSCKSTALTNGRSIGVFSAAVLTEESAVFCIERLSDIVEKNYSRLSAYWYLLKEHFVFILDDALSLSSPTFYLERAIVNLMRLCIYLVDVQSSLLKDVFDLFAFIKKLRTEIVGFFAYRIAYGLHLMFKIDSQKCLSTLNAWETLFDILKYICTYGGKDVSDLVYNCIQRIIVNYGDGSNFSFFYNKIFALAQDPDSKISATKCIDLLLDLHSKLRFLISRHKSVRSRSNLPLLQPSAEDANILASFEKVSMKELWLFSIQGLCLLCRDPRVSVQLKAIDSLQRAFLSSGVMIKSIPMWSIAFEKLLIPLLTTKDLDIGKIGLLSPSEKKPKSNTLVVPSSSRHERNESHDHFQILNQSLSTASEGSYREPSVTRKIEKETFQSATEEEVRIKISNVLFQIFLHNLSVIVKIPNFHVFWLNFIGSLERFMTELKLEASSQLVLHFGESIRNALLVMSSSGVFEEVFKLTGQDLLELTYEVLESFNATLVQELKEQLKKKPT
jgi:brefeldin A-resistance guanine nucleotide exchange factor 1